jgi:hypothetical protein
MGSSSSGGDNSVNNTQTTTLPTASAGELANRDAFANLGAAQNNMILSRIQDLQNGQSPYTLSTQDQALLAQSFNAATNRFQDQGRQMADYLAGSRGLRMSDTPISSQALNQFGLGLADLQGQQARATLDYGLQGNQYRTNSALGLAGALPMGTVFNQGNYLQERMAQPTTTTVGRGYSSGTQTPSGISQGAAIAGGVGSLAMGAAAAFAI